MVPDIALCPQAVITFPEAPPLLLDHDRLQRHDDLTVPRCPIDPRPVVRRPRQPGCLASSNDRQTVLLGHDPDRVSLGRRRQSFRLRTSLIAVFSNARSAYIFFSFAFSASSSRNRLSSDTAAPPYLDFQ